MENNRKDPRRQLIGAVSKALGQQFERDINAAFDHYRRLGVASIEKTPEPFHMTGRENGGKVVGFYEKKAQPDYAGTLRGGRSVYMEAKFTGANRMEQSRVSPGQTEYAFIARMKSGHIGIFERTGGQMAGGGDAIHELMGSSVPTMVGNETVREELTRAAWEKFDERLDHEIMALMNGWR